MDVLGIILGLITFAVFIIFIWEMIRYSIEDCHLTKQTIADVKENIITCLDMADGLGYEVMFRTPECVAYKKCKLHVATTKNGKEVIMVDLI